MRSFLGLVGCASLLAAVGCGGAGTTTTSRAPVGSNPTGSAVALEPCPGTVPGLFAVEPSGALRWSRCADGNRQLTVVTVVNGVLYVVEQSRDEPTLVAIDIDDGTEMWRFAFSLLNDGVGYHAVEAFDKSSFDAGGVIVLDVLSGAEVEHVALDARTGERRWSVPSGESLVTLNTESLVVTSEYFGGDLAGSGPTGEVVAYDRQTGERRWSADNVPYFGGSRGARLAGDTMVVQLFADAEPAGVMGIDLATGKQRWRHDGRFLLQSASADGVFGVASDSPGTFDLVSLAPDDGSERWRVSAASFTTDASTAPSTTPYPAGLDLPWFAGMLPFLDPTVIDDTMVVRAGGVLVGFDARSGNERWRREAAHAMVAAGAGRGLLYERGSGLEVIRATDGTTEWSAALTDDVVVQAAVTDDVAVLSLVHTTVYQPASPGSTPVAGDPRSTSVGCAGGTVLSGAFIPPTGPAQPVILTVLVSADGSKFCITDRSGTEDVVPFVSGRVVTEPEATVVQGVLTDYLVVAVPSKWGQNPQVSAGQGQQLSSAMTHDGTVMLVVDFAPIGATPDQYVERTFTFRDSANQTLAEVTVPAPPTGSIDDALACLSQHGVNVAPRGMPNTGALDKQPMDPSVTGAAWAACKSIVLSMFETSGGQPPPQQELEVMDCMAGKGFISTFTAGEIDESAFATARSECTASMPLAAGELRCDVYTVGSDGALSSEPVRSGLGGFGMGAKATAPPTAAIGEPVTVTIEPNVSQMIDRAIGFQILDHRDMIRTFTVTGATIVPGSLVQDPPADSTAETTSTATDATVALRWVTPIAGGGDVTFPAARFDIVATAPGEVIIAFSDYDSTMKVRGTDGVETIVHAKCTAGSRLLATISVT